MARAKEGKMQPRDLVAHISNVRIVLEKAAGSSSVPFHLVLRECGVSTGLSGNSFCMGIAVVLQPYAHVGSASL